MSTYNTWGTSWGTSWATSWTRTTAVEPHAFQCEHFDPTAFDTNCPPETIGGGTSKRDLKRRKKLPLRWSDMDAIEREEAMRAIPVRPFTPIEQAAANLADASDDEAEDDEIILLAAIRVILH